MKLMLNRTVLAVLTTGIVRSRAVNAGPGPYANLVAERTAALAEDFGLLRQRTPTELVGSVEGIAVTPRVNPDSGSLYENYTLSDPSGPAVPPAR